MARSTAMLLIGSLIVLVAYVAITSAGLVRDLDAIGGRDVRPTEAVAIGPESTADSSLQTGESKPETKLVQLRPAKKRRIKPVSHHSKLRIKPESVTLLL